MPATAGESLLVDNEQTKAHPAYPISDNWADEINGGVTETLQGTGLTNVEAQTIMRTN